MYYLFTKVIKMWKNEIAENYNYQNLSYLKVESFFMFDNILRPKPKTVSYTLCHIKCKIIKENNISKLVRLLYRGILIMLGRKQSLKGEPVLADYGPEESLNESADIEWVNKVNNIYYVC